MFNLFIIGVGNLHGLIIGVLDGLIISHSFGHFDLIAQSSGVGFNILSFIRDLFMGDDWFIIGIIFLNRDIFHPGLRLRGTQSLLGSVGLGGHDDRGF